MTELGRTHDNHEIEAIIPNDPVNFLEALGTTCLICSAPLPDLSGASDFSPLLLGVSSIGWWRKWSGLGHPKPRF